MSIFLFFKLFLHRFKYLASFILFLMFINLTLNFVGIQITPFNAYGMYSDVDHKDEYVFFEVYLDGKYVDMEKELTYSTWNFVKNILGYYNNAQQNSFVSSSESFLKSHPKIPDFFKDNAHKYFTNEKDIRSMDVWLFNYLKKWFKFDNMTVKSIVLKYENNNFIETETAKIIEL